MDKEERDVRLKYSTYGNGKAIIEILNIGFEPLLTEKEYGIYKEIGELKYKINGFKRTISFIKSKLMYLDQTECYYLWLLKSLNDLEIEMKKYKTEKDGKTEVFKNMLRKNKIITRKIIDNRDFTNSDQLRNIAIFESDLTRCFGCKDMEHSEDIVSVVTYYTDIFDSIIHNGFDYHDKHYVFFTAGAGQTRCKKSTFVSEEILEENFNRLFCGLTRDDINKQGGMNTNKYLAYTSLCQTNSEIWKDFNIDKAIVVDDIEYTIPNQKVRYIYTESPEDKEEILRLKQLLLKTSNRIEELKAKKKTYPKGYRRSKEEIASEKSLKSERIDLVNAIEQFKSKYHKISVKDMDVTIPFTDGFGISLKKMQSSMVRLPFIKGLMAYCPKRKFQDWCSEHEYSINKITDIYGKKHSISDVDYIFTKSQFKMWQYYNNIVDNNGETLKTGWEVYKDNFKKYNCDACRCNVERNVKLNGKTNYQVLQTLTTEMTDEDIVNLAHYDINCLNGIGNNVQSMLNILGANEIKNENMNWLQKSLLLYPEMLKDFYIKTLLRNTKNSMIKKFRSGKFNINGAYTYAIPDTLACLQWWFTNMDKLNLNEFGFVKQGHVTCNLFESDEELDCLRSPHLDHAHCIRNNYKNDQTKIWAKSNGIYINMKDTMSKLLMYDNDGDKLLVHNNKVIIKCAKQFQEKYNMIPNYYEMPKAKPELLSDSSLFKGIVMAYHHGNIGTPSNEITKIWANLNPKSTKEEIEKSINIIALRCVDVNFTIDYAKTLYKPEISKITANKYKQYSGKKVPHFFIYAKNKRKTQVEKIGNCNIDRNAKVIKCNRIVFKNLLGRYSYKKLMKTPNIDITTEKAIETVKLYRELENANLRKLSHLNISTMDFDEKKRIFLQLEFNSNKQRDMFIDIIGESKEYITDILVKSLQTDINKGTLWRLFGEVLYKNLENNLKDTIICAKCKNRFLSTSKKLNNKYCNKCATAIKNEQNKKYYKNFA